MRPDPGPDRQRARLRARRRRVLPRRVVRRLRQALEPPARGDAAGRGRRRRRAEGGAAGLRALEGAQGGRGHLVGVALGRRPPGLAHRVLGDGGGGARRRRSRSTAAAPTSSSRTTRTRSPRPRPRAASRSAGPGCTTAWCRWASEKMAKSVGNIRLLHGALDEFGRDAFVMWMVGAHYRKPVAYSEEALEDAARAVERVRDLVRRLDAGRVPTADDSTLRGALLRRARGRLQHAAQARAVLFDWVAEANRRIDAGERVGAGPPARDAPRPRARDAAGARRTRRPRSSSGSRRSARRRARRATSRAPTRSATGWPAQGWEIRDTPEGARLVRRP